MKWMTGLGIVNIFIYWLNLCDYSKVYLLEYSFIYSINLLLLSSVRSKLKNILSKDADLFIKTQYVYFYYIIRFSFLFFTSMGVGDSSWQEKQDLFICLKPKKIGFRPTSSSNRLSSGVWNFSCYPSSHVHCSGEKLIVVTTCLSSSIAFSVTKNNFWTKPNQRMLLQSCDCHEETESFYSVKYSEEKLWPFHVPAFALQVKIWM